MYLFWLGNAPFSSYDTLKWVKSGILPQSARPIGGRGMKSRRAYARRDFLGRSLNEVRLVSFKKVRLGSFEKG